jgi:hypothetical protein
MTWSAHVVDGPMIADIVDNPLALERRREKIHRHPPRTQLPAMKCPRIARRDRSGGNPFHPECLALPWPASAWSI